MNTIREDYVSFEVAKLLKDKGFDGVCRSAYTSHGCFRDIEIKGFLTNKTCPDTYWECVAPTLQMACKWLREVHKIDIEIFVTYKNKIPHYQWRIECLNNQDTIVETPCCNTYEEAVEAAIKYTLKNLIIEL